MPNGLTQPKQQNKKWEEWFLGVKTTQKLPLYNHNIYIYIYISERTCFYKKVLSLKLLLLLLLLIGHGLQPTELSGYVGRSW